MKRSGWLIGSAIGVAFVLAPSLQAFAADAPAHVYVGADKCKMCHNSAAKGAQYTKWTESKHSKAYATLATDEAKKLGAAKGVADPQKAPECLKCHVTGYGSAADKLTDKWRMDEGVGCESCHGPGGDYWKMETMKDQAKATAAGLVMPVEATCVRCHNTESPSYKKFEFEERKAKIAHPNPQKASK
ncbi:MAG TPA: cytochrome c family protein [Patescibacteria group bacterium]|jgi:hypothetical protein|nr:cytochrome c family protein [Patescibacteria group bacterium]